jgi:predicted unusual protein kinase regulating ubiquinone biosynthesis (AarF/ABC1/UbiB family)
VSESFLRVSRGLAAVRLAARGGARYAANAPRLFARAGEQRQQLRDDLALRTAQDVADTLGTMKGVLMKIGQLASYVDDGLAPPARRVLGRLQDSVPPMSSELAAGVIVAELGDVPETVFSEWDPRPIAAASIGQVHRAITRDGRAVAVKVQYPGIAETIAADLGNVGLLRSLLRMAVPSQDVTELIDELRERVGEELDYLREADNQRQFAAYFDGHPTITVPKIVDELSTARVITSELATGARYAEMLGWSQPEKDLAAETIYRFTFRSLYELHAFNGDPHPGNYLFEPGGQVTFLDFGLVKHFTPNELDPLVNMIQTLCIQGDPEAFRRAMENAGFLAPGAPIGTDQVVDHMALFYDSISTRGPKTMTSAYASAVARRYVDFKSPLAAYAKIPRSYVILQRINLGLFAILGEMNATANWRAISEEIWPFLAAPPSTPMAEAEAGWHAAAGAARLPPSSCPVCAARSALWAPAGASRLRNRHAARQPDGPARRWRASPATRTTHADGQRPARCDRSCSRGACCRRALTPGEPGVQLGPGWAGGGAWAGDRESGGGVGAAGGFGRGQAVGEGREKDTRVGVSGPGGVHRADGRGGDVVGCVLVPGREEASVRPEPDDDVGAGGAGEQEGGRLVGGYAGEQGGLAGVAAEPVAPGEHRVEHLRGDLRDERSRVDEQQHGRRQRRRPAAEVGTRVRRDQAVAGYVDGVARAGRDRVPAARPAHRLGPQGGHERPLGVRLDQRDIEAGVGGRIGRAEQADAFGREGGADQVPPVAGAVTARVQHRQALPGGGRHHVKPAPDRHLGRGGEQVAAARGQSGHPHHHVDDGLTREDEPARPGRRDGHGRLGSIQRSVREDHDFRS